MSLMERLGTLFGRHRSEAPADLEMISCEEALAVVYDYLDGELPASTYEQVRAHFEICARCYPTLRLEESFRIVLQRAARGRKAPPELEAELKRRLAAAREDG